MGRLKDSCRVQRTEHCQQGELKMNEPASFQNPDFPFGEFQAEPRMSESRRMEWLVRMREFPVRLEADLSDLTAAELSTCYRRWTVSQIVHHVADAQLNWFLRFKFALTELRPQVHPFDESKWIEMPDGLAANIKPSLDIIRGINARWWELCQFTPAEDFTRTMFHPERNAELTLDDVLVMATWHCCHHLAQIQWMRKHVFSR